ncbi:amidohydrolase [Solicola sp. PLA-1-18]|uniref:amidohydrolase n=1 Tax=Solicola sp. PLA-1-18 TaxID=3380532 RepID=UPI003B7B6C04
MAGTTATPRVRADTVLRGVVRVDATSRPTDAVAVRDGLVVALGRDDCSRLTGPGTDVVDLDGVVAPAFVDAHAHPVMGGLNRVRCDLDDLHDLDRYRARIADHAARPTSGGSDWLVGSGWYGDVFPAGLPTAAELDAVVGGRPAVLTSHDVHSVWVSSEALRRAGIDATTPDPAGGRIERDADGRPTGVLMESAAALVTDLLPAPTERELVDALLQAQAYLHSVGVAGWQDAAVGEMLGMPDLYPVYRAADAAGLLTARVTGALWWDLDRDESQVAGLVERRAETADRHRFRASAVKIMQDGVCENLTAAVVEAYRDVPHDHGLSFLEPERLREVVAALAAERFDVHLHAVGDRAVRECLDAVETSDRSWSPRHQVAHIDLVQPDDLPRFGRLGVIANVQPLWAREDRVLVETKLPHLTEAQRRHHFAFGSLHAAGARLAFGSDWPVSSPDPLWALHVAVNRTAPDGDPHAQDDHARTVPLLEHEGLAVADAFTAATAGAAHASRLDTSGTLHPGMAADLVLLDRDPLAVPRAELGAVAVRATYVAGRPVYEA